MAVQRIWVGGSGRSGTTLMYEVLRAHPEIHAFPVEMRFVVDPDGLIDLVRMVSTEFSPMRSRQAWVRFRRLMLKTMNSPRSVPYGGYRVAEYLGPTYKEAVVRFLDSLLHGRFRGRDLDTASRFHQRLAGRVARSLRVGAAEELLRNIELSDIEVVRWLDETEALRVCGTFLDQLFLVPTSAQQKKTWCEKTPANLLHAEFLLKLVPDSIFVHVIRDPRGVAQSYARQVWGPGDLQLACRVVNDIYHRWFAVRERLDASRLIEVKLEELSAAPATGLRPVTTAAGVAASSAGLEQIDSEKVNYWRRGATAREMSIMNRELEACVERLGYSF